MQKILKTYFERILHTIICISGIQLGINSIKSDTNTIKFRPLPHVQLAPMPTSTADTAIAHVQQAPMPTPTDDTANGNDLAILYSLYSA